MSNLKIKIKVTIEVEHRTEYVAFKNKITTKKTDVTETIEETVPIETLNKLGIILHTDESGKIYEVVVSGEKIDFNAMNNTITPIMINLKPLDDALVSKRTTNFFSSKVKSAWLYEITVLD